MASVDFKADIFKVTVKPENSEQKYTYYDYKKDIEKTPWWSKTVKSIVELIDGDEASKTINPRRLTEEQNEMAKGIDKYSHIGALEGEGNTIAVLGHGLDIIYPAENYELSELIEKKNGLIVTEYVIGTKPNKYTFPARNRIISGLSDGVIVVEAKERSGSLITADFALEQGKEVFAVPGNIDNINSHGTNELIKQGAYPITNCDDVLNNITYFYNK